MTIKELTDDIKKDIKTAKKEGRAADLKKLKLILANLEELIELRKVTTNAYEKGIKDGATAARMDLQYKSKETAQSIVSWHNRRLKLANEIRALSKNVFAVSISHLSFVLLVRAKDRKEAAEITKNELNLFVE